MSGNLPDDWSWRAFDAHFGDDRPDDEDDDVELERHARGCICHDCAGAEITAEND